MDTQNEYAGNVTPEQYRGIVQSVADYARRVAAELDGERRRGAEIVATEIEAWVEKNREAAP